MTALGRMAGEKKTKISSLRIVGLVVTVMSPPLSSVLLNLFFYMLLPSCGKRFFSFSYFSLLFPVMGDCPRLPLYF